MFDLRSFLKNTKSSILTYGFQSKISTANAILDVVTNSYENIQKNLLTGLVLVDLRKAFDTVSHQILLTKLENYGIGGVAFDVINSHLKDRKQYVSLKQIRSAAEKIQYGVPQGSSIGPFFFHLYK